MSPRENIVARGTCAEGNNVFQGADILFDLSFDMKGTMFYIVLKNPHHAQQGNGVRQPFLIGSWD
jgi:hypothetical protein